MSFVSHAHATHTTESFALSARPDAPVVPDTARTPRFGLPRLIRLSVAWQRRADAHERTWEIRWRPRAATA